MVDSQQRLRQSGGFDHTQFLGSNVLTAVVPFCIVIGAVALTCGITEWMHQLLSYR